MGLKIPLPTSTPGAAISSSVGLLLCRCSCRYRKHRKQQQTVRDVSGQNSAIGVAEKQGHLTVQASRFDPSQLRLSVSIPSGDQRPGDCGQSHGGAGQQWGCRV